MNNNVAYSNYNVSYDVFINEIQGQLELSRKKTLKQQPSVSSDVDGLQNVISRYLSTPEIHSPQSFPVLFTTKSGLFRIRSLELSQIDSKFAEAHRLTRQAIKKEIVQEQHSNISTLLASFEEKQISLMDDMIPFLEKYLSLIRIEMTDASSSHLYDLFFAISTCVEIQKKLYQKDPSRKQKITSEKIPHEEAFISKVREIEKLQSELQVSFPNLALPVLQKEDVLSRLDYYGPFHVQMGSFLDTTATQKAIDSHKDRVEVWPRFRYGEKDSYTTFLYGELEKFSSFQEAPLYLQQAFYKSPHVSLGQLLKLPMFTGKIRECIQCLEKCTSIKSLCFDQEAGKKEFLDTNLTYIITKLGSKGILDLDFSDSQISDTHLLGLPKGTARNIDLSSTMIEGIGLKSTFFHTIEHINLSNCTQLQESNLCTLPCKKLLSIDLSETSITGTCLQSSCYKNLVAIDLTACTLLQDCNLALLSSEYLKTATLSETNIRGQCFESDCFKTIHTLDVSYCRNLQDVYFSKMSCKKLKKINFSETDINGSCLLAQCFQHLQSLNVSWCLFLSEESLKKIENHNLVELNISNSSVQSAWLPHMKLKNLKKLYVGDDFQVPQEGMEDFSGDVLVE